MAHEEFPSEPPVTPGPCNWRQECRTGQALLKLRREVGTIQDWHVNFVECLNEIDRKVLELQSLLKWSLSSFSLVILTTHFATSVRRISAGGIIVLPSAYYPHSHSCGNTDVQGNRNGTTRDRDYEFVHSGDESEGHDSSSVDDEDSFTSAVLSKIGTLLFSKKVSYCDSRHG
ncbi:hypothetical protein PAAG_12423 [Paracoccidioides lutzii Pb01]|uniref:Uncharacterized protein n=1 Tax=Paracoccidioides lutzii (strain ATCC MYA-826 / Pb01) TaxID=502779 RepID=A0A0A2V075_PARBA|nr:hypothetical protein PAAG_12423 [Paracoccidioides lutzii Pb01]KGQ00918.1 hypothetical protein PAAG_12423 [Paracoccidioides lutzii Pb01]